VRRPEPLDLATWARAEHFEHYRTKTPCTYAITVEIDVTELTSALRRSSRKAFAAQVWALAAVVNRHEEFRLTLDEDGNPATWPVLHPAFTVFNPARETFACVWTPYDDDFGDFHGRATDLLSEHQHATTMFPQGDLPPDTFDVSSLPWTAFSAFALTIAGGEHHLLPIFTFGRYVERDGRTLLPLAVQVHHAAADGFHTARLNDDLRRLVAEPGWL
jgi:chloramphenicol O-acetyltransferase type A